MSEHTKIELAQPTLRSKKLTGGFGPPLINRRMDMRYILNDGGRYVAGFKGSAGDCAARAMAIALGLEYKEAYNEVAEGNARNGLPKSARNGVMKNVFSDILKQHGWVWCSAPRFASRKARCGDLPVGMFIARQAKHFVAVLDGVPQDTFDCTHKMVYGYWKKEE